LLQACLITIVQQRVCLDFCTSKLIITIGGLRQWESTCVTASSNPIYLQMHKSFENNNEKYRRLIINVLSHRVR
jgi:hypothetical protein